MFNPIPTRHSLLGHAYAAVERYQDASERFNKTLDLYKGHNLDKEYTLAKINRQLCDSRITVRKDFEKWRQKSPEG